jgi:hypothetical protein
MAKRMRMCVPAVPLHKLLGLDEPPTKPTYGLDGACEMPGMTAAWGYGAVAKGTVPVIRLSAGPDAARHSGEAA